MCPGSGDGEKTLDSLSLGVSLASHASPLLRGLGSRVWGSFASRSLLPGLYVGMQRLFAPTAPCEAGGWCFTNFTLFSRCIASNEEDPAPKNNGEPRSSSGLGLLGSRGPRRPQRGTKPGRCALTHGCKGDARPGADSKLPDRSSGPGSGECNDWFQARGADDATIPSLSRCNAMTNLADQICSSSAEPTCTPTFLRFGWCMSRMKPVLNVSKLWMWESLIVNLGGRRCNTSSGTS
mmetsp:Transcript_8888/g.25488  ORF Transcript_8888/g.25488 Transcript_8888/m.25488 type:complete len:236 (-) Transcript_8888:855-1562(-)